MRKKSRFFAQVLVSALSIPFLAAAQAPSLDPAQTVNTATGEMSFSLPLGVVNGANGHNFPVTLGYHAGIQLHEPASEAGLGFSCVAGAISRKPIFMADDCPGGFNQSTSTGFYFEKLYSDCDMSIVRRIVSIVIMVVAAVIGIIISIYCPPAGAGYWYGLAASLAVTVAADIAVMALTKVQSGPKDYIAGGSHLPSYKYCESYGDDGFGVNRTGDGKGFFRGGEGADLPDLYFVNTPFVSGELVWVGPAVSGQGGHFVLKSANGGQNVAIDYSIENNTFLIKLPDGTRLFFDRSDKTGPWVNVYGYSDVDGKYTCDYRYERAHFRSYSADWLLTKIVFADHLGSDIDPLPVNSGSWVAFDYDSIDPAIENLQVLDHLYEGELLRHQASSREVWDDWETMEHLHYLKRIRTPNESAEFIYVHDRIDGALYKSGSSFVLPRLQQINFLSKSGGVIRTVTFNSDYYLRANTPEAIAAVDMVDDVGGTSGYWRNSDLCQAYLCSDPIRGNPSRASLTLESLAFSGSDGGAAQVVTFEYGKNPALSEVNGTCREGSTINGSHHKTYRIEDKDVWGYYCARNANENDWNLSGDSSRACDADAWSLKSIHMPNGGSIGWTYEANRYDAVNGVTYDPAKGTMVTSGGGRPKFGGGIRVKKIVADNGLGGQQTLNYFYTDKAGSFVDSIFGGTTCNSSGHATLEPYNYISASDYRLESSRGGFYTPVKVAYEMTQVVNGYIAPTTAKPNGVAPHGYTVYEFVTSKDFPNGGSYGQIDESWQRGMVKRITQFNSSNRMIQQTQNNYIPEFRGSTLSAADPGDAINTYGWVRLASTDKMLDNVHSVTQYKYAQDLLAGTPDQISETANTNYIVLRNGYPKPSGSYHYNDLNAMYTEVNAWGTNKPDIVIAAVSKEPELGGPPRSIIFFLKLVCDVDWQSGTNPAIPASPGETDFVYAYSIGFDLGYPAITGIEATTVNGATTIKVSYKITTFATTTYYRFELSNVRPSGRSILRDGSRADGSQQSGTGTSFSFDYSGVRDIVLLRSTPATSDLDGQPNQIIQTNTSDDRAVGTIVKPAYWATPYATDMLAKHMLTQTCQSVTYDLPTSTSSFDNARVVSAGATVWSAEGGVYLPQKTYAWRANMTSAGLPNTSFVGYVFSAADNATNPNWSFTGQVESYTAYSQPIQTKSAAGVRSTTIYDKNSVHPYAAITNAARSECIFTSWEDRATGGLVMGTGTAASIDVTTSHAGVNSLKLAKGTAGDPYVLTENTPSPGMTAAKKVRWEFWAKADAANTNSFTHLQASDMTWYGDNAFIVGTTWQKFAFEVTVPAGKQYHVVLRAPVSSGHAAKTGTIWYDDVRAYPSDAMMSSYTYDPVLGVPTSVTDANNNTSKTTYDDFGRVKAQYDAKGRKVKENTYHLMNE